MPLRSTKDYSVGIIYFILFILTIPAMNWVVMNVGTVCTADGPCLIPVWPGIMAPSGVLMAGVALVLRDGLQAKTRCPLVAVCHHHRRSAFRTFLRTVSGPGFRDGLLLLRTGRLGCLHTDA